MTLDELIEGLIKLRRQTPGKTLALIGCISTSFDIKELQLLAAVTGGARFVVLQCADGTQGQAKGGAN